MLNRRWFRVRLDAAEIDEPPVFLGNVKQLDGTVIVITPLDNKKVMDLRGSTAKLFIKKPDGTFLFQEKNININVETSEIEIYCANSIFSEEGTVQMELEIYDNDNYMTTTPTFEIDVIEKLNQVDLEDFEESTELQILSDLVLYIEEQKKFIERFRDLLAEFGEDDNLMLENLLVVRGLVETLDEEVEKIEQKIEEVKALDIEFTHREDERQLAETTRISNEIHRYNSESLRQENEKQRILADQNRELRLDEMQNSLQLYSTKEELRNTLSQYSIINDEIEFI